MSSILINSKLVLQDNIIAFAGNHFQAFKFVTFNYCKKIKFTLTFMKFAKIFSWGLLCYKLYFIWFNIKIKTSEDFIQLIFFWKMIILYFEEDGSFAIYDTTGLSSIKLFLLVNLYWYFLHFKILFILIFLHIFYAA